MHEIEAKSILSAQNGINVYRGCTHGCIYCDSRSVCYQMEHLFTDVAVKSNSPTLLEEALLKKRSPCMIGTGSMCDPYLPLEAEKRLTEQCLKTIYRLGFGVSVLTKSDLVLRDLPLLKAINERTKAVVCFTLTTFDDSLCRIIEPNVCVTSRRLRALEAFHEAGVPTVVWLCPLLPFINDTEENLRGILEGCFSAGVKGILTFGMGVTLRAGSRDYFYGQLTKSFPGMKEKYQRAFGNSYQCPSPRSKELWAVFTEECQKHGVLYDSNEVFSYLMTFESKRPELRLF